jgi:hypothetical protein
MSSVRTLTLAAALALAATPAAADARIQPGATLENVELPTLAGGKAKLLGTELANVVLFWRPGSPNSTDTLKQMASCEKVFAGKSVHMVTVVSGAWAPEDLEAAVKEAGLHVPVLLDPGDALYGRLQIRQHPLVLVADGEGTVTLSQPYVRVRYCEIVWAHVRYLLGELDEAALEKELHPARADFPSDDKANVAKRYVTMGKREAAMGKCDRAQRSFAKALELHPGDADALAGKKACDAVDASAQK